MHVRWLPSLLGPSLGLASARPLQAAFKSTSCRFFTPVTYLCKLLGIFLVAAFLQLELFRVYVLCRDWTRKFPNYLAGHFPVFF
ncbi:hypothetical protein DXZ79_08525 [Yersinia rochesterensis]|uniref:Uncharacterized protein n=1 Tax=Yersinia rochesterensis TaxID=1604335 RepID=A0A8D4SQJ2_9GAMM|nr:hypothetical protein DXZ79_08525 [Yersinia rochesterensis]